MGKKALPAIAYESPELSPLMRSGDAALAFTSRPADSNVVDTLRAARARGLLTVALCAEADRSAFAADHVLAASGPDSFAVQESWVTTYHLLWELVHVFLESPGAAPAPSGAFGFESLYPSLYRGANDDGGLERAALASTAEKIAEIAVLRPRMVRDAPIEATAELLARAQRRGATLFTFGNGGSSCDARAIAELFAHPPHGRAFSVVCLSDGIAAVTALANDVSFDVVFARQLEALARPGDVALGISTSGGSANVLRGLERAARSDLIPIGMCGYDGGKMNDLALAALLVVNSSSIHRIQEAQTTLYHQLWKRVQELLED